MRCVALSTSVGPTRTAAVISRLDLRITAAAAAATLIAAAAGGGVSRPSTDAREDSLSRRPQCLVERRCLEGHQAYRSRRSCGGRPHNGVRFRVDMQPDEAEEKERGSGETVRRQSAVAAARATPRVGRKPD